MTKKDFELIAAVIKDLPLKRADREAVARTFGARLLSTNPRFQFERFMSACEVES